MKLLKEKGSKNKTFFSPLKLRWNATIKLFHGLYESKIL